MNETIKQYLLNSPATAALAAGSDDLGNLSLMEEALLEYAAFVKDGKTRVIVKKNKYDAMQLYARLSMLEEKTTLFAMDESLRVSAIASSPEERIEMVKGLHEIATDKPRLIVVNAAAFLRYLPDPDYFRSLAFPLKTGMEMSMNELHEKLQKAGYVRTPYAQSPLTYASRGGITDIYSPGSQPVRVEFFDTEIDSIRLYDSQSQRTIKAVDSAQILPASLQLFSPEQKEILLPAVRARLEEEMKKHSDEDAQMLEDHIESDLDHIENDEGQERLYRYFPWTTSFSLLDYIDGDVVLSSREDVTEFAKKVIQDNAQYMSEETQDLNALPRWVMFHDLYTQERERKFQSIHQFVNFNNPVSTGIYPIQEPGIEYTKWIPEEAANKEKPAYFALEPEDIRMLEDHMDTSALQFVEPVFYQGFETDDFKVYTRREIFRHVNRRIPYQKEFSQSGEISNILELEKGDYIVHATYGIGQYLGIETKENDKKKQDYLHIAYRDGDEIFVPLNQYQLIRKYVSSEGSARLSKLGSGQWEKTKEKVSARVDEIAERLVDLYSARSENIGFAYPTDDMMEREFDEAFEFESTPDQISATAQIKAEMEKPKPMDHLLIGDVGFGKTEVAMRCAFKAVAAGKQVAFLCPTTILSLQHYQTLSKRFDQTGVRVELVNRFISAKEMKQIRQDLESGRIDILVGTHRLFSKTLKFKDLGLLVVDEEQRFGVVQKERIKEMKNSIDVLSLSATPIPRTLQMSLIGVRTISQLNTPPAHRHPVQTYVMERKPKVVEEVISRELARSGQVFYLHNKVKDIYLTAKKLEEAFPDVKVGVAHGQMSREEIENVMLDFAMNKFQILVCTTIIETGLDIANANTIIIENADHFGLAQLYQIRGRVGRRERLAYCYLMVEPRKQLSEDAAKRLKSIKEFTSLGSGYKIAMRDLTIRGAGDMLGPKQAGFIDSVGLDLYLDMLSEAIAKKKGTWKEAPAEKKSPMAPEGYIPAVFADTDGDKLTLYQEIRSAKSLEALEEARTKTADLFGTIPAEVKKLFEGRRIELFVNNPDVESLQESKSEIVIVMTEDWSKKEDGLKLFEAFGILSRAIKLAYKNKKIQVTIPNGRQGHTLLLKAIDLLENSAFHQG